MHQFPEYVDEDGQRISRGTGLLIRWQQGPLGQQSFAPNGSMVDQPVRALLHRVEDLDAHLPCPQNREIVRHLNAILGLLDERTRERNQRGVLGTTQR